MNAFTATIAASEQDPAVAAIEAYRVALTEHDAVWNILSKRYGGDDHPSVRAPTDRFKLFYCHEGINEFYDRRIRRYRNEWAGDDVTLQRMQSERRELHAKLKVEFNRVDNLFADQGGFYAVLDRKEAAVEARWRLLEVACSTKPSTLTGFRMLAKLLQEMGRDSDSYDCFGVDYMALIAGTIGEVAINLLSDQVAA